MRIVSTSYTNTISFDNPERWLKRISFYTGILDALAMNHEVHSMEQINYSGTLMQHSVQYHFLNYKKPALYFPLRLHRFIKNINPDIVLVNGFVFPLQIIQLRLKLGKKVKIIVWHRAERPATGIKKILQRIAGNCINAYLFASTAIGDEWVDKKIIADKKKIKELIQASSIFYAENVVTKKTTGNPIFLWVGRLDNNKDPLTVIKAFVQFLSYQPSATLYMIYQSENILAEVQKLLAENSKAAASIKLVGNIAHEALQSWYNSADFIVSGSHYEGSGIAVCEGMSCGCIPILTSIPSFVKMTGPGKCGILYNAGSESALLNAFLKTRAMDIPEEKNSVLLQFNQVLSFTAIAKKLEDIIENL